MIYRTGCPCKKRIFPWTAIITQHDKYSSDGAHAIFQIFTTSILQLLFTSLFPPFPPPPSKNHDTNSSTMGGGVGGGGVNTFLFISAVNIVLGKAISFMHSFFQGTVIMIIMIMMDTVVRTRLGFSSYLPNKEKFIRLLKKFATLYSGQKFYPKIMKSLFVY